MNTIHTLGQNHEQYMQSKCIWKLIFGNTKSWFGIFFLPWNHQNCIDKKKWSKIVLHMFASEIMAHFLMIDLCDFKK